MCLAIKVCVSVATFMFSTAPAHAASQNARKDAPDNDTTTDGQNPTIFNVSKKNVDVAKNESGRRNSEQV